MSIDLFGQVAADSLGFHQQSATGGQVDFVRGAQMSINRKSFSMKDRVYAMISLAHPAFRQQLQKDAKKAGLIP